MSQLWSLVREATKRALSPEEATELCALAADAGSSSRVLLELLRANTAASRENVKRLSFGLKGHPPSHRGDRGARYAPSLVRLPGVPFAMSSHALERFKERHASEQEAISALALEASAARPIKERTFSGDEQWRGPSGVVFVIRRGYKTNHDAREPVCTTVLPTEEAREARARSARASKNFRTGS